MNTLLCTITLEKKETALHNMANEMRNMINSYAPPESLKGIARASNKDLKRIGEKAFEKNVRGKGLLQRIKKIAGHEAYGFRPWEPRRK